MTDDDPGADEALELLRRRREPGATVPELVHKYEIDRAVDAAKVELRREFATSTNQAALERLTHDAREATAQAHAAARGSRARFAFALVCIVALAVALAMQVAYASENRERIERLERLSDR